MEQYAGKVIALQDIFNQLPEDQRRKIILYPERSPKLDFAKANVSELLTRFSPENREKVERLTEEWQYVEGGLAEIIFKRGKDTVFRACAYASQHIAITAKSPEVVYQELERRFGVVVKPAIEVKVRIPLAELSLDDISDFVKIMKIGE